jgi:hypothetical protein
MTIKIFKTSVYIRFASQLPSGVEIEKAEKEIEKNPTGWPVIPGTGGIRKARFAIGNKGKRGGGRICYFYFMQEESIHLLKAYSKNEKIDLTPSEKNVLRQIVKDLKNERT